ncbi:putative ankyrin repeat protein RF_0381 [Artemia franciscana]|uniref:putative ankyrin repeat protein RF_0381 n=1 Tax=Artemia franciscana TaxID=6661 RepID=UPI0032DA1A58
MLKFLPKLHRIYYKSRFKIEGKNIKEINAELDMVFEFVEYVLGKGGITCMQTKCISGQTLLHHAVWEGKADLCNLLIKSGAELDATNVYGETPLGTAIRTSNLDLVKCFQSQSSSTAISTSNLDLVKCCQSQSSSTAISTSNLDLVKFLLNRGANPNCGECLHHAVKEGRADICKLLIGFGAKLDAMNAKKDTPLLIAIRNNNLELVKLLLKRGANPNCGEYLHLAVKKGSADVCNLLIKSGAEIDATNVHGETPLGTAIKTSNVDLVKLLLKRGANPNCGACLHLAVEKGRSDLCELLIDSGANLDAMNANKEYPLHVAVRNKNLELVNFLLVKAKTDPNCGRKRRRNAEEHETVILQEKMDLDNATLSVSKRCRISKDAMSK